MADQDEGATPGELIIEACRRDNTSLLEEVIADLKKAAPKGTKAAVFIAETLNKARDGVGQGALHVAAFYGSYSVLDVLLDQEDLEIDEKDRMEHDTPLHKAVRYANNQGKDGWAEAQEVVDILLDAGCDPRIRNKAKLKPLELVDPRNTELRQLLQRAEYSLTVGNDVVVEDDDEGPTGSASDSE